MAQLNTESFKLFESLVKSTGGTYAFDGDSAVATMRALLGVITDMGCDPMQPQGLKTGIQKLFNIEVVNMPDMAAGRYILTPNHVSDFDALTLGTLAPNIRIVSKAAWVDNARLRSFLDAHFDLYGLDRASLASLRRLLADSIDYFNKDEENKHFLIFSQGTISDFNNNSPARISTVAAKLSAKTGVPILPVFTEQVSTTGPTRIVFGQHFHLEKGDDFRTLWLENEKQLQNSLNPPARRPHLTEKHANNNKPGDPFF